MAIGITLVGLAVLVFVAAAVADAKEVTVKRLGWRLALIILLATGALIGVRYWLTQATPCFPDCSGASFLDRNFSGRTLSSGNFIEAFMPRVDLTSTDLRNTDFSGAVLRNSDFRGSDLRFAFLIGSDLSGADFGDSNLTNATLRGADLTGSNLAGVDLTQTDLLGATLREATLIGADLSDVSLVSIDLRGADLSGANLQGADLAGAVLSEANLSGANLRGANLQGAFANLAFLTGADLREVALNGASLIGTDLTSANLRGAGLVGALVMGATFDGADLRGATLRSVRDIDQVTPGDIALDPALAALNMLQLDAISVPSRLDGVLVDESTLADDEFLSTISQEVEEDGQPTVRVGILHSVSGALALGESAILEATLLAIDEINAAGGILGRKIEPIVEDGASVAEVFAEKATKLTEIDEVDVVFGGATITERRAIMPILEASGGLLFFPAQNEGLDASRHVIQLGADPSQLSIPAVNFLLKEGYETFYLVGTDRLYASIVHPLIKAQIADAGATVLGEAVVDSTTNEVDFAVREIAFLKPSITLSTLTGSANRTFFESFASEGLSDTSFPVFSLSMGEAEVRQVGAELVARQLVAASYFQLVGTLENFTFVDAYREAFGREAVTSDAVMYGYSSVYLWRALVEEADSFEVEELLAVAESMPIALETPNGLLELDPNTLRLSKPLRIGQIREDGLVEEIFTEEELITSDPFLSAYPWAQPIVERYLGEAE